MLSDFKNRHQQFGRAQEEVGTHECSHEHLSAMSTPSKLTVTNKVDCVELLHLGRVDSLEVWEEKRGGDWIEERKSTA